VVAVGEAAAGPADDGGFYFFEGADDVGPDAANIFDFRVWAHPDSAVDAVAKMLGKMAVNVWIDGPNFLVCVDDDGISQPGRPQCAASITQ